ncbi:hypothetical protein RNAN_0852 [Rheinheimera nanhaiensis E407-8]|uniref:Uncharacterized protein n=1 Tax=Rheinheimera nanhaiensis E407-8 TaxID=562729 RepID=I1DV04_9GAMM|nr:hypothetical protein RNAN_0852 [Rheinheimera nanhaiensis E407-8]
MITQNDNKFGHISNVKQNLAGFTALAQASINGWRGEKLQCYIVTT